MADRYVNSAAVGAADGTTKADAFVKLSAALTAAAAGDRIFVAHTHSESTAASITPTSAGIISNYVLIISVNFAGSTPPVAADYLAGALVATGNGAYSITFSGFAISIGVNYTVGVGASAAGLFAAVNTATEWIFENCTLELATTSSSSYFNMNQAGNNIGRWVFKNVIVKFGHVSQYIYPSGFHFTWIGGSVSAAGSAPTNLFYIDRPCDVLVQGVDLVHLGAAKNIMKSDARGRPVFRNCKTHASVTLCSTPSVHHPRFEFQNCNSGDVNYYNSITDYYGALTPEITIVLTGGATDGTTPISHKIVATANAAPETPFRSMPIQFWNETVGSAITVTLQGIWGGGAVPDDDEIWVEADYLGTSGFPLSSRISDRMASLLSTPAGQAAGAGTWGGGTTKFALSVTFTPAEKGIVSLTVCVGVGGTFYVDPKPVVT